MMKPLPFEKYELKSSRSLEELYASIDNGCEPWNFFVNFGEINKPLFGKRSGNKFRLYKANSYNNAWQPIAYGTIHDNGEEILVEVSLRMHILVFLFTVAWLSFILIAMIAFRIPLVPSIGLIGMFVCGCVVAYVGFWFEVPKIKKLISDIMTL